MNYCNSNCTCLSVIAGVIAGVVLGILYALGFVATGVIFWAYLALAAIGILLAPLYASLNTERGSGCCFCTIKNLILIAAIGAIVFAAVGLIIAATASTTVVAIILGLATAFSVILLSAVICLTNCLCERYN